MRIPTMHQPRIDSLVAEFKEHFAFILDEPVRIVVQIYPAKITEPVIREYVCEAFDIAWKILLKEDRNRERVCARNCYAYLCEKYLEISQEAIAENLKRDRSTVTHNLNKTKDLIESGDTYLIERLAPIIQRLNVV